MLRMLLIIYSLQSSIFHIPTQNVRQYAVVHTHICKPFVLYVPYVYHIPKPCAQQQRERESYSYSDYTVANPTLHKVGICGLARRDIFNVGCRFGKEGAILESGT